MSYPRDLDEYSDVELVGEVTRRKEARAKGLCDYCNRPVSEPSCRFPLRHRPAGKIEASGSGLDQSDAYRDVTRRLAKCIGFWLAENPGATEAAINNDRGLDARAERAAPGFSGGMWGAAVREALRRRDDGTLDAWLREVTP